MKHYGIHVATPLVAFVVGWLTVAQTLPAAELYSWLEPEDWAFNQSNQTSGADNTVVPDVDMQIAATGGISNSLSDSELVSAPVAMQDFQRYEPLRTRTWMVGYRFRTFLGSATAYEFGMPAVEGPGWSPLSRLEFPLNSCWHGLEVGLRGPTREIHFEWLMPQQGIDGDLADYDWSPPNPDGSYTDLGYCKQRWIEGQMLDLNFRFKWSDRLYRWPIAIWPMVGFRWQRFNIMCCDAQQVKWDNVWLAEPFSADGDVLSFEQQYYVCYIGSQFRRHLPGGALPPTNLIFQWDLGYTSACNVDHHLLREGDRFSMESTTGLAAHLSLSAEMLLSEHWSLGLQADYLHIDTEGRHRLLNEPEGVDCSWTDGVSVWSQQTWLTVFIRLSI